MKNKKRWKFGLLAGSVMVLLLSLVGACAPAATPPAEGEKPIKVVNIGAAMGGSATMRANMRTAILKEFLDIDGTAITWPSIRNADALRQGAGDMCNYGVGHAMAWEGSGIYEGEEPFTDLRMLLYDGVNPIQLFVLADSPYKTFTDLIGKKICVGKAGTIKAFSFAALVDALGYSLEEDFEVSYYGYAEAKSLHIKGLLDAQCEASPPPHPAFTEMDMMHPLRVVTFTKEEVATIAEKVPFLTAAHLDATHYHMDAPVDTVSDMSGIDTTVDLPEEIAYGFTKAYIENPDFIRMYTYLAADNIEQGVVKEYIETLEGAIPFHVGAIRYFNEIGWKIPESSYPPEWGQE